LSRIDHYEPHVGGFRAKLAAAYLGVTTNLEFGKLVAVSLDSQGRVVIGTAGSAGFKGCILLQEAKRAGEQVDVFQIGQIVEFTLSNGNAAAAGTTYTSNADGTYGVTAPGVANFKIGHTVEAGRLMLRCAIQ
jgi:hypothetical protein